MHRYRMIGLPSFRETILRTDIHCSCRAQITSSNKVNLAVHSSLYHARVYLLAWLRPHIGTCPEHWVLKSEMKVATDERYRPIDSKIWPRFAAAQVRVQ